MSPIVEAIIATLVYYDIFSYPLTEFEIWKYLMVSPKSSRDVSLLDISIALNDEEIKKQVSKKYGFYFLSGREDIVDLRLARKKITIEKWNYIQKFFSLLSIVPWVRGVFVSGSLAMENSRDDSDIDVLVVTKFGRIWTARTFMTLATALLGVRRYGNKTKDRICLNHYITDQSLRITFESLYNAQSYKHLVNVYREDQEIFSRFQQENQWLDSYLINHTDSDLHNMRSIYRNQFLWKIAGLVERVLAGRLGDCCEYILGFLEAKKIRANVLYKKAGGRVTIDDTQLEFHPDSHEFYIIPQFNKRAQALGLLSFCNQKDSGLN